MDVYSVQQLYCLGVLCAFGSVLTQTDIYLVCPSDVWEPGATITLQCFVQKASYPDKCVTENLNITQFSMSESRVSSYITMCTVTDPLGRCHSTGDCRCGTENSSHYLFEYEFTADTHREGYWSCGMGCSSGLSYLTFQESDCGNRKVYENPNRLKQELMKCTDNFTECKEDFQKEALRPCPTPRDSSSSSALFIGLGVGVVGAVCVVMAAVAAGVHIGKRRSGSHQNAPSNNAPLNNAHPNNAHPNNAPPNNAPPNNAPPDNGLPSNSPADDGRQAFGQAGPSTGGLSIIHVGDSSADASEASEVSESAWESASGVG